MNSKRSLLLITSGILLALGMLSLSGGRAKARQGSVPLKAATVSVARGRSAVPCPVSFTVNTLGDTPDANPGDNVCNDGTGNCTLRAAMMEANVLFSCPAITVNITPTGVINLGSALPPIGQDLIINGPNVAPGLKDSSMHRPPRNLFPLRPDLLCVDSLQSLVLAQHQTAHIPANVIEPGVSVKHLTVLLHSSSDGRRHSYQG